MFTLGAVRDTGLLSAARLRAAPLSAGQERGDWLAYKGRPAARPAPAKPPAQQPKEKAAPAEPKPAEPKPAQPAKKGH